jgi:hypothetical protein
MIGTVTTIRARARQVTGTAVRYEGGNAAEVKELAGDRWLGAGGGTVTILTDEGDWQQLRPGWVLCRPDGAGGVTVWSPAAWARWMEETP